METASFEVEKNILDELRKDAESKQIPLKTLIGIVCSDYIRWYANAPKAGMIPIPKEVLVKIMDAVTDEEISQIAKYSGEQLSKGIIITLRKEHTVESFMDALESWAKTSNFPFSHQSDYDMHSYVIHHGMGKKWAQYFEETFRIILEQLGMKKIKFDVTNNTLTFSFDISQ